MLGLMKKFNRAAVLSDKTWLKKVSELEGLLYPGLEIKAFRRDQKAQAEAWLSGYDDVAASRDGHDGQVRPSSKGLAE